MQQLSVQLSGSLVVLFTSSNLTGFYSQKLWEFIFLALEPWAEGPGVGLGPLAPETSLPNFYPPHVRVGTLLFRISASPTHLDMCSFFSSIVVGLHSDQFLTVLSDCWSV